MGQGLPFEFGSKDEALDSFRVAQWFADAVRQAKTTQDLELLIEQVSFELGSSNLGRSKFDPT